MIQWHLCYQLSMVWQEAFHNTCQNLYAVYGTRLAMNVLSVTSVGFFYLECPLSECGALPPTWATSVDCYFLFFLARCWCGSFCLLSPWVIWLGSVLLFDYPVKGAFYIERLRLNTRGRDKLKGERMNDCKWGPSCLFVFSWNALDFTTEEVGSIVWMSPFGIENKLKITTMQRFTVISFPS